MQPAEKQIHRETLEEEATHTTDEARMLVLGAQVLAGGTFRAVFQTGYDRLPPALKAVHASSMTLITRASR